MKGTLFGWLRTSPPLVAATSIRTRIRELVERQGFARVEIRHTTGAKLNELVYVLAIDDTSINGHSIPAMISPEVGRRVWRFEHIELNSALDPGGFPLVNDTLPGPLEQHMQYLARELQYDERYCIYESRFGERFYVNGGFNNHKAGFTALKLYPTEYNPNGNCASFFDYVLTPFYEGKFILDGVSEPIPNFIYYDWMGNRVRDKSHIKAKQMLARGTAVETLESMLEVQRTQTRNMEHLLNKLKQAQIDVH
jgi:hypothetical protein